jgi:hypothetical protein
MRFVRRIISEWPAWSLAAFMLALPLDTSKFGPGNALSLSNIAFVIAAAGVVWTRRHGRVLRSDRTALAIAAVFALSFVPGTLVAADKSLAFRTLVSEIGMGAAYSLVVLFSRDRASLLFAAGAWVLGGLIAAAAAIAEYALWLAGVHVGTGGIAGLCGTSLITLRAEGFTGSTNYLGFFVLIVGVAAFGLAAQPGRIRWLGLIAGPLCCLAVLLSYSRGTIVALAAGASLAATVFVFGRTRHLVPRVTSIVLPLVVLVLLTRLLVGFNVASVVARINIANNAVRAFASSPVSGTGLGSGVPLATDFTGFCEQISVVSAQETAVPTTVPIVAPTVVAITSSPAPTPTSTASAAPAPATGSPVTTTATPSALPTFVFTAAPTVVATVVTTFVPTGASPTEVPIGSALTFALAAQRSGPVLQSHDTHMTLLQATTNAGLLGALGYLVLVVGTLWYGTRRWAARSPLRTAFVVSALATQVAGLTVDALAIKQMYVALGFLWAIAALEVGWRSDSV